jgi:uncharacterized C2H2 Zn-finger protein
MPKCDAVALKKTKTEKASNKLHAWLERRRRAAALKNKR